MARAIGLVSRIAPARGHQGADTVTGKGADTLYGHDSNDALNSRYKVSANDTLDGGPGTDTRTTDPTDQLTVMTFAILSVEITAQPAHTLLRSGA